jgi:hypothetical protein
MDIKNKTGAPLTAGDVLLFSGDRPIYRRFQALMKSPWGQVGIVVCSPEAREPCLLMSTSLPISPNVETGVPQAGVWTTLLHLTVEAFEGMISARRLSPPLSPELRDRLSGFRRAIVGRPFDFSMLSARRSLRRVHTDWQPQAFMCASLVTHAYQAIGVVCPPPKGPLPSNTLSKDYSSAGTIKLNPRYSFSSEIIIRQSASSAAAGNGPWRAH